MMYYLPSKMVIIFPGSEPSVMIVEHPAAVARSAAIIFVIIPPVPNELPEESTTTVSFNLLISSTTLIARAFGSILGLLLYKESTSVNRNRYSALIIPAVIPDNVSLSPKRISACETYSRYIEFYKKCYRIILINDGYHFHRQQFFKSVASV